MAVEDFFLVIGMILMIGFFGRAFRERTGIPESLFLIMLGIVLGPLTNFFDPAILLSFVPVLSILALTVILLESSISLDVVSMARSVPRSIAFTLLVGILVTAFVSSVMYFYLGYNLIASLILGVISSGTTTITITALLEKLSAPKPVKDVLLLESVVNDLTVIIATFIILDFIQAGSVDFAGAIRTVVGDVLSAIVTGFFAAIIWQRVLVGLHVKRELSYMSTLGAALITYYAGFLFGANPIVTVFVFGLSLANLKYLSEFLQMGDFLTSLRSIRTVQQDITFFVRTFFFVILGIIFNPLSLSLPVVTVVGLITMLVLLARLLSSSIMAMADPLFAENRFLISVMIPRGFTATILAFIPAQYGFEIPFLSDIVLLLVFSTTLFAIVGTTFVSGAYAQEKAQNEKKKGKNG